MPFSFQFKLILIIEKSFLHCFDGILKVYLEDSSGRAYSKEGKLIGADPAYDLAVLKVSIYVFFF